MRSINTDIAVGGGMLSEAWSKGGTLGRSLIGQILLANALLSIFASSIQLYSGYHRDQNMVLETIGIIDDSFRDGFSDALWDYNFRLVEALMNGVYNKSDVEYVRLTTTEGRSWELGTRTAFEAELLELTFTHRTKDGTQTPVGKLRVGLTLEHAWQRLWSQTWTLLASNFAKTALACIIMLVIFDRRVSRHLKTIAAHVARTSWPNNEDLIQLDRPNQRSADELDYIVTAINTAKHKSHSDMAMLEREIEQRQILEALLKHRSAALEEANREQAEFTYALSHDLKAPANTISMLLAELGETEVKRMSPDGKEILNDAEHTVSRMTSLVEDVLGYARTVESDMQAENIDLGEMTRDVKKDLRGNITVARAQVVINDLPTIEGNAVQMRLLMQNLLSNAVKFRSSDRSPVVTLGALPENDLKMIGFYIRDNGIGIASEFHEKVFGLFQRLHAHGEYDGTGLGLSLCKRIVNNHGGTIGLTSVPDEGSRFEIWLPRRQNG